MMFKRFALAAALLAWGGSVFALGRPAYVATTPAPGGFVLAQAGGAAPIWVDEADWPGVIRAAGDLQADMARVTGVTPVIGHDAARPGSRVVIIGTLGRSALIDRLARDGRIDVSGIRGQWESFFLQTVRDPLPGVSSALVIAGSDKRGTIYGIYDLSEQIGVSPWYWWADVTPDRKDALFVKPGTYQQGEPSVKYRGIFLNDEKPDLDFWVRAKFGEHPTPGGGQRHGRQLQSARSTRKALRGDAPAEGQLPLAGDVEQRLRRGRSGQCAPRRRIRHRHGHLAPGADDARAEGMGLASARPVRQLELRHAARRARQLLARRASGAQGLRKHLHHRPARRKRHADGAHGSTEGVALTEQIVDVQRKMLARGGQSRRHEGAAALVPLQGGAGILRARPARARRRDAALGRRQLGQRPPAADRRRNASARAARASTITSTTTAARAATSGSTPARSRRSGSRCRLAKQYGADRIWIVNVGHFKGYELPDGIFPQPRRGTPTRWTDENTQRIHAPVGRARIRRGLRRRDRRHRRRSTRKYNGRRKPELLDATHLQPRQLSRSRTRGRRLRRGRRREPKPSTAGCRQSKRDAFYELVLFPDEGVGERERAVRGRGEERALCGAGPRQRE